MDGWISPLSLRCYKSRMMSSARKILTLRLIKEKYEHWDPSVLRGTKKKETMWVPVVSVLTRWCHWEQVRSWPPICATVPQWWCWTAGVCDGSARDRSPSQCWKAKQDVQKCCRNVHHCSVMSAFMFLCEFYGCSLPWQEFTWWEEPTDINLGVMLLFTHTAVILSSRKVTKAMPSLFMEMRFFSALNSSVRFSSNSL